MNNPVSLAAPVASPRPDVDILRVRSCRNVDEGAVGEGRDACRSAPIGMVNQAFVAELARVLSGNRHYALGRAIRPGPGRGGITSSGGSTGSAET
jgi:hypothetical protein